MSVLTEACHASIANRRFVPFPLQLGSKVRQQKAEQKATEAALTSGRPCIMKGCVGETDGHHIARATTIIFEWLHVRCFNGDPLLVHIRYDNLISHGRSVPNCPIHLAGWPGLVYSVEFFEQFAANICPGLGFCALVCDGFTL